MNNQFLKILKCPETGQSLILKNNLLFSEDGKYSYPIDNEIPRFVPKSNCEYEFPFNYKQLKEWALLDTFDWLAPEYDNPQTKQTVTSWINQSGLIDTKVLKVGHLVARGQTK